MRGISIEYGAAAKDQEDLGVSMGWSKKRKQKDQDLQIRSRSQPMQHDGPNNGRAPDTTATLLPEQKKRLGRPKNSPNINRNPLTTFPSYCASDKSRKHNQCWLAAGLECLYLLYSPLWIVGTNGSGKDLFTTVVQHFNSRATYNFTRKDQIQSTLTKSQNKIFELARNKYPGSFEYGRYASCNYFMEICLDPKRNPPRNLKSLFVLQENQIFTCQTGPHNKPVSRKDQEIFFLPIKKDMFSNNKLETNDIAGLIKLWTTTGLKSPSGLCCKPCKDNQKESSPLPKESLLEPSDCSSHGIQFIDKVPEGFGRAKTLTETSTIKFCSEGAPLHLYFDVAPGNAVDWSL